MVEQGVNRVLSTLLDAALLVGQRIQRAGDKSRLLHHEDDLADSALGREALEDGAEGVHGALPLGGILLVGGSLDDLLEETVLCEAAETDAVEQGGGECVGCVERNLRVLAVDLSGDLSDVVGRGRSRLAGDHDLGSHGG